MILRITFLALAATLPASPAAAQLADPVRAMIEAAIAKGDKAQIEAVVAIARETQPDGREEIDRLYNAWLEMSREAEAARLATEQQAVEEQDTPVRWTGKGEVGAFRATGNSDSTGLSAALALTREGDAWSHKLSGRADYQRTNDLTTRERFLAAYEPRYQIHERLFAYGLTQFERDRIQGFSARYALSGGVGYHLLDREDVDLSLQAGPALRITRLVAGGGETRLAGLLGLDFDWRITDRLTLTQDTNAVAETGGQATLIVDSANTTLNLVTGLDAKITDRLTTRLSYSVDYDSNPPAGGVKTDTFSRFTLVYGF